MSWLKVFVLTALTFSAYSFILSSPFKTLDDQSSIVDNATIKQPSKWRELFTEGYFRDRSYYRPLVNLSFMVEYRWFGLNPFFYNLDNVIIHILNALLVWMLVASFTNAGIGFWSALLFAIHPIQWEAVSNISGRAILLSTLFSLVALNSYLKKRHILAVFSFLAALLCKESAVILPGILGVYILLNKKDIKPVFVWGIVLAAYVAIRQYLGITEIFKWGSSYQHILGVLTFLRSLLTDIRLFIWPMDLHFDRSLHIFDKLSEPGALITMACWLMFLDVLWIGRRHISRLQWFCLAWFLLCLLPVSQLISSIGVQPGRISTAEHFLYLACVPIFVLVVDLLRRTANKPIKLAAGGLLLFFFFITIEQNIYAQNELAMVERSLRICPHNARLHSTAGLIYALSGQFVLAEGHFRNAVLENPISPRYKISLGKSICDQGRFQECLDIYNEIKDAGGLESILAENKSAALRLLKEHKHD